MWLLVLLIVCFIYLSGLMAMIDAAVLSVSRAEVEEMIVHKKWGAKALRQIKSNITRAVVVIVILTNAINVLGPILVGYKAVEIYGNAIIGVITAVLTFGTIVFSEIIPKSVGSHYAPRISRLVAPGLLWLIYMFYPVVIVLEKMTTMFKSGKRRIGTEEQIRSLVQLGRKEGYIEHDEGQLIDRAFVLNDETAADVMIPIDQMIGIEQETSIRDAAQVVFEHTYSRYPVYKDESSNFLGIVLSRSILQAIAEGKDDRPVRTIMHWGLAVPSTIRCDELLERFRREHTHIAIVKDEDEAVGLVTLEDVLEQLVGEIEDELDTSKRLRQSLESEEENSEKS